MELKSKTFTINKLPEESLKAIKEDVGTISCLKPEKFSAIIDSIKKIIRAKTEKDELKIQETMIAEGLVPNLQVSTSIRRLINYFFRIFYDDLTKDDLPENIASDFVAFGANSENKNLIEKLLLQVKQESEWYNEYQTKKSFEQGLFPSLARMGTTVELRGVFDCEIEGDEKLEEYTQRVTLEKDCPIVSVISIAITLNSGTPDRFVFQASPEEVKLMIERLKASLHKAQMLTEYCIKKDDTKC